MAKLEQWPGVRRVTFLDLIEVIALGLRDFRSAPQYGLIFGGIYTLAGWLLVALLFYFGLPYLAYPLAMGFALIAPFAAVGFYAVSEHLERAKPLSWRAVFASVRDAAKRDVRWMALITGFALVLWMDMATLIFFAFTGLEPLTPKLINTLFTTANGLIMMVIANAAGALIALVIFSISVISFPMLYDRDIDFVTAMVTSVRLVKANPKCMILWCAIIAVSTMASIVTAFVGLFFVLPVIGHATWHLYRRAVEPVKQS